MQLDAPVLGGGIDVGEVGLGRYTVTLAPRSMRVSTRTVVWTVMWGQLEILAPLKGLGWSYCSLRYVRPGQGQLLPAPVGQGDVCNFVGNLGRLECCCPGAGGETG